MVCENLDLVYVSCCVILKSTHTVTGLKYPFVQYNVHLLQDSCLEFMAIKYNRKQLTCVIIEDSLTKRLLYVYLRLCVLYAFTYVLHRST